MKNRIRTASNKATSPFVVFSFLLLLLASSASAGVIEYSVSLPGGGAIPGGFEWQLPGFDPSLGTLTEVLLSPAVNLEGVAAWDASPWQSLQANLHVGVSVSGPGYSKHFADYFTTATWTEEEGGIVTAPFAASVGDPCSWCGVRDLAAFLSTSPLTFSLGVGDIHVGWVEDGQPTPWIMSASFAAGGIATIEYRYDEVVAADVHAPEPSTVLLLTPGLLFAWRRARRRVA